MRYGPSELLILLWIITIVALVDVLRVPSNSDFRVGTRVIWVLVILCLSVVGAALYYAIGKPAPRRR